MTRILITALAALALAVPAATAAPTREAATRRSRPRREDAAALDAALAREESRPRRQLSGKPGAYTVFAPTNAAFAKVPKATLDSLAKNPAALKRVLLYHVVAGKVPAAKVVTLRSAKTLAGPTVRIRVTGKTVRINSARVTKADVMASNGIVHVIDRVLIPPAA